MKKYLAILISALVLTGCGTSGTSQAEESFIAGSGAVTTIREGSRQKAPAISGMTLSGENYSFAGSQLSMCGHHGVRHVALKNQRFLR
jgi:hypothetical protein